MSIFMILIPCLMYNYFYAEKIFVAQEKRALGTCGHQEIYHVPCGRPNITADYCRSIGCCHIPPYDCFHSLPSRQLYNTLSSWSPDNIFHPMQNKTPFGVNPAQDLKINVQSMTRNHLKIEIWNPNIYTRDTANDKPALSVADYDFEIYSRSVIEVNRTLNSETILTTARGPLISSLNFMEWNVFLGTSFLYGLDGNQLLPGYRITLINRANFNALPYIMAYSKLKYYYNLCMIYFEMFELSTRSS